jgi:two-component system response regulator HydG
MSSSEIVTNEDHAKKVLLVDDEIEITELLGDLLRSYGFFVATANDGVQAIVEAQKMNFDIVVSDVRMPDMDGLQLMDKLKIQFPKLGFIIISGFSIQDEHEILKRGAYCFLHKPVSPKKIAEVLNEYFGHGTK